MQWQLGQTILQLVAVFLQSSLHGRKIVPLEDHVIQPHKLKNDAKTGVRLRKENKLV